MVLHRPRKMHQNSDAGISGYIASSRIVVQDIVPPELFTPSRKLVAFAHAMSQQSEDNALPQFDFVFVSTLQKFSESVVVGDKHYVIFDQFFSLQSAFLNKSYF